MNVTRLKLANLRAITSMEFKFQPGCNLIVGVNGVGKTSVLDALAVCLSPVLIDVNRVKGIFKSFELEDIRAGSEAMTLECGFDIGGQEFNYLIHKPRMSSVPQRKKAGMPRQQVHVTPERAEYIGRRPKPFTGKERDSCPMALLFSTRRAVPSDRSPGRQVAAGGSSAALADAFADRELRLGDFASWMRVQQTLKAERPAAGHALVAFEEAVRRFLPDYKNLHLSSAVRPRLMIDRGKTSLEVRQLSDGERGILAMVLDLTRRLAQANPRMRDPAATAEAVVLIDEIDLHLHPQWQREVLQNLTAAFPKCQFIATTHSPQVIGEIQHDRIQIMADGKVYPPSHSYGVDSSRVLEEIMGSRRRALPVDDLVHKISEAVRAKNFKSAQEHLEVLTAQVGEDDPEVTRARGLIDFLGEEK